MKPEKAIEILEEVKELDDTMYAYNPAYMNAMDMAIEALKEIQQYREIGTVEECREAVEKQKAKKPKEILRHRGGFEMHHCPNCDTHYQTDNRYTIKDNYCPVCGKLLDSAFRNYCGNCGQAIQWDNLEGTEDENT